MKSTFALLLLSACSPTVFGSDDAYGDADADADADSDSDTDTDSDTEPRPEWCPTAEQGLWHVEGTPAGPYYVHNPAPDEWDDADTVFFLPGGQGAKGSTEGNFMGFFGNNERRWTKQFVLVYSPSGSQMTDWDRIFPIYDEIMECYGGDPDRVHLFGHSMGGFIAFGYVMKDSEARFATVTGAPAAISGTDEEMSAALEGVPVHFTAGELDGASYYKSRHEWLLSLGVDSTWWQWPGQGHVPDHNLDSTPFFEFWDTH